MSDDDEHLRPAAIEHGGARLTLDAADLARIGARAGDLVGSRRSATYLRARYKYPAVPEPVALALAAAALGLDGPGLRARLSGAGQPLLVPATVTVDGRTWRVTADEREALDDALSSGTWRVAGLYSQMKARTGSFDAALALTAALLGDTVESVRGSLEWHDGYMRFHDGDPDYTIF